VIFTGRVPHQEILGYYGLIDVFVVPRVDERVSRLVVPLKPYEAMATGRALVVSDVAALREMIEEGVNGLLFRAGDAQDLACIVEPLLRDPASREALGRSARRWVTDHRSWRENGARYLALYRSLGAV
jgi:glycosyltransferase involved in cell wall biosynthesis